VRILNAEHNNLEVVHQNLLILLVVGDPARVLRDRPQSAALQQIFILLTYKNPVQKVLEKLIEVWLNTLKTAF